MLVVEAAEQLTARGRSPFRLSELIVEVQRADPARARGTIQPVVQGTTANAGKGPTSPCGKVLVRVVHGHYRLRNGRDGTPAIREPPQPSTIRGRPRQPGSADIRSRIAGLIADFDQCVEAFDSSVPFTRFGQYKLHRQTINRRFAVGPVEAAIHDEIFTELLHETLKAWGIGRRASKIAPLKEFRRSLVDHTDQFRQLESVSMERLLGSHGSVWAAIDSLITDLAVVDNRARIVAGTKTLHHLLPELVPPMDRAWTGAFFGWSAADPQNNQSQILGEALEGFAEIARATHPSRLVGEGWRTSSTKVLDNALIGYCKLRGIGGGPRLWRTRAW